MMAPRTPIVTRRMDEAAKDTYRKLLNSDALRANLTKAGLYSLAFELLKRTLIDHPKGFFTHFQPDDQKRYNAEVLSLEKSDPLIASAKWFHKNGALSANEVDEIATLREYRNRVVHELQSMIVTLGSPVDEGQLLRIYDLLSKIELWWITEIEIPANEVFDGKQINPSDISGARTNFLKLMILAAFREESAQSS